MSVHDFIKDHGLYDARHVIMPRDAKVIAFAAAYGGRPLGEYVETVMLNLTGTSKKLLSEIDTGAVAQRARERCSR
jgi:hypothetical protein